MTGGGAAHAVLEPNEELTSLASEVAAGLGLHAVVNLAFRYDGSGQPKLLEINPRIPFAVRCALGAGVNLVALSVRQALGETVAPPPPRWGGHFLLHFSAVVTDASGSPVGVSRPGRPRG
jgi:predicted ATP-grasp superfamily ATP-dependent carboligase